MSSFGRRLARQRQSLGLTQIELANSADVSVSYLRKLEQGSSTPAGLAVLQQLARALATDVSELVQGRTHAFREGPVLSGTTCAAVVDRTLYASSITPEWASTFPGTEETRSLLLWLFTDPRARIVLERWRLTALGATSYVLGQGKEDDLPESLLTHQDFLRIRDAHNAIEARKAVLAPGGCTVRSWQTRTVRHNTLWVLAAQQSDHLMLVLNPASVHSH